MQPKRNRRDRAKLPEFAKNLNASQRGLLTKFSRTGERDMTKNRATDRHIRIAAWERRMAEEAAAKKKEAA